MKKDIKKLKSCICPICKEIVSYTEDGKMPMGNAMYCKNRPHKIDVLLGGDESHEEFMEEVAEESNLPAKTCRALAPESQEDFAVYTEGIKDGK